MTEATGHFAVLRRSFSGDLRRPAHPGRDHRLLLRRADRGARRLRHPGRDHLGDARWRVGFKPIKAAAVALVANTAPVAFGAIAIPIVTLAGLTDMPKEDLGAMVGRQTPFLALIVPLILVGMVDGRRGVRQTWPAALVGGLVVRDRPVRVLELHLGRADRHRRRAAVGRRDRRAPARLAAGRAAAEEPLGGGAPGDRRRGDARRRARGEVRRRDDDHARLARATSGRAYAPYLIIIVVFSLAQSGPIKDCARPSATQEIDWPGLNVLNAKRRGARPGDVQVQLAGRGRARCC